MQDLSCDDVYSFVKYKLSSITNRSEPETRAVLAILRRGVGRKPGELPQLYGEFLKGMPEKMYSSGNGPSYAEWAVYIALTLYALHQQGKNVESENMNRDNVSLGEAASRLAEDDDERERIWRRLCIAAQSDDMTEMSYHLRGLVQLLRAKDVPLDYPRLAKDLYLYQLSEKWQESVRLKWGQDFYRTHNSDHEEEDNNEKD